MTKPTATPDCPHSFITNVDGKYKPGDGVCVGCEKEIIAMTPATPHTPTPWKYKVVPDKQMIELAKQFGESTNGLSKCEISTVAETQHTPKLHGPTYIGVVNKEANAAYIVQAVNSHERLVKALEEVVGVMTCSHVGVETDRLRAEVLREAEAALKEAGIE